MKCLFVAILVYRNSSICAASLKNAGPCLVSHCLCSWIVKMGFKPDIVEDIHNSRECKF